MDINGFQTEQNVRLFILLYVWELRYALFSIAESVIGLKH